jgi:hypothetical protein
MSKDGLFLSLVCTSNVTVLGTTGGSKYITLSDNDPSGMCASASPFPP